MTEDVGISTDELMHYGMLRRSGRYPWGSGMNPNQHNRRILDHIKELEEKGLTQDEIAKGLGGPHATVSELRLIKTVAKNELKAEQIRNIDAMRKDGLNNVQIGEKLGVGESQVRHLSSASSRAKVEAFEATTNELKRQIDTYGMIDIGAGAEYRMGVSRVVLDTAVQKLYEDGYEVHGFQMPQVTTGNNTNMKVIAAPGTPYRDVYQKRDNIQQFNGFTDDNGQTYKRILPPLEIDPKRLQIKYHEDGGSEMDGMMYVRPGAKDLDMGGNTYAQVRIAVKGDRYLKGMAILKDDLPEGVDIVFHTNKSSTGNKLDALKQYDSKDPANPFGAIVRQLDTPDPKSPDGRKLTSAINIVNDDDDWEKWSKTLSSQMLSKQRPALAAAQLEETYNRRKEEFDKINALTNPTVKAHLLKSFSEDTDAAAVHLKAAALPRQKTHVIIPVPSMKDNEVYAPNYKNGEVVVLVRYPHSGTFEIPELVVNNNHKAAKKLLGDAPTAIGINANVANRLSGADFDGDTVVVIPNNDRKVVSTAPLPGLKDFDTRREYPGVEGMVRLSKAGTQGEMGRISNLVTDMTIKGASLSEIEAAARHSMVVIDAAKHGLNYKQSERDNRIKALKAKYQGGETSGASTLISRASSDSRIDEVKLRAAKDGGPIDKKTGKLVYEKTGATYEKPKYKKERNPVTGKMEDVLETDPVTGKQRKVVIGYETKSKVTQGKKAEHVDDLHLLTSAYNNKQERVSSGTQMETIYANHGNKLKKLADQARLEMVNTKPIATNPSAKKVYASEIASLKKQLDRALENAPRERQAQVLANVRVAALKQANPNMDKKELQKSANIALQEYRQRLNAKKVPVEITPKEWEAIQAGAVSPSFLTKILNNTNVETVKAYATPRQPTVMTNAVTARAKALLASGYTVSEVASSLGVAVSTLRGGLDG